MSHIEKIGKYSNAIAKTSTFIMKNNNNISITRSFKCVARGIEHSENN